MLLAPYSTLVSAGTQPPRNVRPSFGLRWLPTCLGCPGLEYLVPDSRRGCRRRSPPACKPVVWPWGTFRGFDSRRLHFFGHCVDRRRDEPIGREDLGSAVDAEFGDQQPQERFRLLRVGFRDDRFEGGTFDPRPEAWSSALDMYVHCPYATDMAKVARATDRWDFRVAADADEFVRRAADVSHRTLTDFVVEAAVIEADRVLGDRTRFALEDEEWMRFMEVLNRPPQENPGRAKLFSKPSVFE